LAETDTLARDARRAGVGVAALILLVGALALNHDLVGVFYDDGFYAGLALALAHGQGFVQANLPGAPAAIHYPPLYPLLLAPLFGTLSVDAAGFVGKLVNLACATAAAGLVAWHATRAQLLSGAAPRWLPAAVVGAAAAAIPVLQTQSVLFSEPLFALLFAATVALADTPRAPSSVATPALAGAAAALTLLTRTIGVAAGAGIVLFLLVVRGSKPVWQFCHIDDLLSALEYAALGKVSGVVPVASDGWLTQEEVEEISGMRRMELPEGLAVGAAERLHRLHLTPAPASDLQYVMHPWAVSNKKLREAGWEPAFTNEEAFAQLLEDIDGHHAALARRLGKKDAAAGLGAAGATVALVGTAALVRRARRKRRGGGSVS